MWQTAYESLGQSIKTIKIVSSDIQLKYSDHLNKWVAYFIFEIVAHYIVNQEIIDDDDESKDGQL